MYKKKLILYAQFYYPEVASLAQLCTDLCNDLAEDFDITVITSVPCYTGDIEEKYQDKKYYYEEYNGVNVIRVRVPQYDKGNKLSRIKNILAYFFRSLWATFKAPKTDYILTESQPPILGGLLGVAGKWINLLRFKKSKLLYVIQDYNPEQTIAVGFSKNKLILLAMKLLDKFSCVVANKVIVVGRDMLETMKKRFPGKYKPNTVFINNWIDDSQTYPLPKDNQKIVEFKKQHGLDGKFVIMYSGNIGLFYDLENLIKVVEKFKDYENVVFPFVGEGTLKEQLMQYVNEHGMKNVVFIPYQAKEDLIYSLNSADVHWIVNAKNIKGVSCPSKLYGLLATAEPALAVLEEGTEAREIIESTRCGYAVSPEDYEGVAQLIEKFINTPQDELENMGNRGYKYMKSHFTKKISISKYRDEILNTL